MFSLKFVLVICCLSMSMGACTNAVRTAKPSETLLATIPAMEITFLAAVVTHSLIGLRGIVLDLKPARNILKIIDWVMVIFGVSAVVYGIWLALTIASKGG